MLHKNNFVVLTKHCLLIIVLVQLIVETTGKSGLIWIIDNGNIVQIFYKTNNQI